MNTKTFKEELEGYLDTIAEIDSIELRIKKIEKEDAPISGSNFAVNGDIRPAGYMNNNAENYIIKKNNRIKKLELEREELKAKVKLIDSAINTLNSYHKRLIELRYKFNLSLAAISTDTERSEESICRTLNKCIEKMTKKWEKWTSVN